MPNNTVSFKFCKTHLHIIAVGVFLSGGLDSGTMVALSSQYSPNITTLGFAYEGDWNEMPQARQIAEKYNTNHHEVFLEENRISEILQKIKSGEHIDVLDNTGDWFLIKTKEGKQGYVHKSRIKSN